MKRIVLAASVSALMVICSVARADVFSLSPSDPNLDDLDHSKYYTWGVSTPWPTDEQEAVSATLSFNDIYNWTTESNVLYIHLLDMHRTASTPATTTRTTATTSTARASSWWSIRTCRQRPRT